MCVHWSRIHIYHYNQKESSKQVRKRWRGWYVETNMNNWRNDHQLRISIWKCWKVRRMKNIRYALEIVKKRFGIKYLEVVDLIWFEGPTYWMLQVRFQVGYWMLQSVHWEIKNSKTNQTPPQPYSANLTLATISKKMQKKKSKGRYSRTFKA